MQPAVCTHAAAQTPLHAAVAHQPGAHAYPAPGHHTHTHHGAFPGGFQAAPGWGLNPAQWSSFNANMQYANTVTRMAQVPIMPPLPPGGGQNAHGPGAGAHQTAQPTRKGKGWGIFKNMAGFAAVGAVVGGGIPGAIVGAGVGLLKSLFFN